MLCFAYGSNMDFTQMQERCPSAKFVVTASLRKHRLAFTRKSTTRGCGVADVVPDENSTVWGVVYEIPDTEVGRLDQSEGYQPGRPIVENAYRRVQCQVHRGGKDGHPVLVTAYLANSQPNPPLPNETYKKLIVDGAKHWHLPAAYVTQLESIEVQK